MRRLAALLAAGLIAGCAHFDAPPRHEIVGYYAGWKEAQVDPALLTVVNYAFLDICWDRRHGNAAVEPLAACREPNGALTLGDPARDVLQLERLASIKAKRPGLKLVGSVGGWSRSNRFSDMAADPGTRAAFIDSTVAFIRNFGFDGIDIDWEYPGEIGVPCASGFTCDRPQDKRNFVTLARELRAALDAAGAADGKHYLSTIAAGCDRKFAFDGASAAWIAELAASLDWVNLMTYDYHGTWEDRAGHVAPLYADPLDPAGTNVDATVTMYLEAGVPARKLTLGVPFYGKGWTGCEPGPRGDGQYQPCKAPVSDPPEATYEFSKLADAGYFAGAGLARHRSAAGVPYLYDPASRTFISYDDEASVRDKMRYAVQRGLRGAMYWEIAQDRNHELAAAIAQELGR
ncbi:MAG TPA: glycoside hydrolase family 18 protein [Usitatibacter sp.]|nr:glycoside hydrolase family 18 protein [Usitatibacter sp.]